MRTDRRTLLQAAAALPLATVATNTAFAQTPAAAPAAAPPKDVTRTLAHYIVTAQLRRSAGPMSARKASARS